MAISEHRILEILNRYPSPGSPATLVESGAIQKIGVEDGSVRIALSVPAPEKAAAEALKQKIEAALLAEDGVEDVEIQVQVHLPTFSTAPKAPEPPPKDAWAGNIKGVKHVIAVASGKGGVGKSTISTNLATALSASGAAVGLLDGDIYGPSQQMMTGAVGSPQGTAEGRIVPMKDPGGFSVMSLGFIIDADQPVIWRGPLLMKALEQLISDVEWGELDYLIVDLPPGTGDITLSLAQNVPLAGAVIVTTPQDVALLDARKALRMFEKLDVPVLGLIENMSGFTCPECGHVEYLFGEGGGKRTAETLSVPFLGAIPLDPAVVVGGDTGRPIVTANPDAPAAQAFVAAAENLRDVIKKTGV